MKLDRVSRSLPLGLIALGGCALVTAAPDSSAVTDAVHRDAIADSDAASPGVPMIDSGVFASTPGQSVRVDGLTLAEFAANGGYSPIPPLDAACNPAYFHYAIHLETALLDWSACAVVGDRDAASSYTPTAGSRMLTASERSAVDDQLYGTRVIPSREACVGRDFVLTRLKLSHGSDSITYTSEACSGDPPFSYSYSDSRRLSAFFASLLPH